ncbi:MAG: AAA family ATPase, partial [Myxococcota bacterium]
AVRKQPGRVILFDELEKAHSDVLQLLLQILDDGRLTDGHGRTVSFADCLIILTSNLGADLGQTTRRIGFDEPSDQDRGPAVLQAAQRALAPELWGRIEEKLVFEPLKPAEIREIARLLAGASSAQLGYERGITYELDDRAIDFLVMQGGHDLQLGARPMRQVIARLVEAPIAQRILEGRLHADECVRVSTRANGSLIFVVEDGTSLSQRPARRT